MAKMGHITTDEAKKKMSLAKIGKKLSEEHKKKISLASIGKKKIFSEQALINIRNARAKKRGIPLSESTKMKLRISNLGRKFPYKPKGAMREETKRKIGDANRGKILPRGELHFNWKGGKTEENMLIRASAEYKEWRNLVYDRDKYQCQKCGILGGRLQVHHIINFAQNKELRININNGITFCKHCHTEFHKKYGTKNNNEKQIKEFIKNN